MLLRIAWHFINLCVYVEWVCVWLNAFDVILVQSAAEAKGAVEAKAYADAKTADEAQTAAEAKSDAKSKPAKASAPDSNK